MKGALILCLFALSLFLVNSQYNVRITDLLTPVVASDGFLILDTRGLNFPLRMINRPEQNQFQLIVTNEEDNSSTKLSCFLYQFESLSRDSAKIGCRTRGLAPGKYSINPLSDKLLFSAVRKSITLLPFTIVDTFEVTEAKEVYFYEYDDNDEDFERSTDRDDIDFHLFEPTSEAQEIYFEDIPVKCRPSYYELKCPVTPKTFDQAKRRQTYTIFIKDTNGLKKRNYFVHPATITLEYSH